MKTYSMTDLLRGELMDALIVVQRFKEDVLITRYGKPIARLCPLRPCTDVITDPATWLPLTEKSTAREQS